MVIFPPEKLHVSPPPILSRIAHVFLQSCQDCIAFRLWGGKLHFPPFNPLLPSAILLFLLASAPLSAIPPPFFSSSLSGPRIVFRRSHNQSQFCNPTFSSSLQSSTSQPTTLARLQSHAILTRNSFFFTTDDTHNPPHAILLDQQQKAIPTRNPNPAIPLSPTPQQQKAIPPAQSRTPNQSTPNQSNPALPTKALPTKALPQSQPKQSQPKQSRNPIPPLRHNPAHTARNRPRENSRPSRSL